jgi:hypothetical protein
MKIVQTLWLPEHESDPLKNSCGWLSPEYHWLSWILCINQLKKFYNSVELYANQPAKEILIDQLALPYTKVHALPDTYSIPSGAWALSKIVVYSLQREPFLHVDGDVFIWKPFDENLLKQKLITQNKEIGFDAYAETLKMVNESFQNIPPIFQDVDGIKPDATYNAGIIGGSDLDFFKDYAKQAIGFVMTNQDQFKSPVNHSALCMLFEQWLFSALAKKENKNVSTLFSEPVSDVTYPGLADFLNAGAKGYLHFMGITKRNRYSLKQMVSKVRQEYPDAYYHLLKLCRAHDIDLDFKVYQLPALDPVNHSAEYFQDIIRGYNPANTVAEEKKWVHYYGKDAFTFYQAESFHALQKNEVQKQLLSVNKDVAIAEVESEELQQSLKIQDTFDLSTFEIKLDDLEIVILDALQETPKDLVTLLESIKHHFDENDFETNKMVLLDMLTEKSKKLMHQGVVRWVK